MSSANSNKVKKILLHDILSFGKKIKYIEQNWVTSCVELKMVNLYVGHEGYTKLSFYIGLWSSIDINLRLGLRKIELCGKIWRSLNMMNETKRVSRVKFFVKYKVFRLQSIERLILQPLLLV